MKALSIQQPWAWLIVNGHKSVENRTWATSYRGPLLIHAGQRIDRDGYLFVYDHFRHLFNCLPGAHVIARGGIVGTATLVDVLRIDRRPTIEAQDVPWFFGPFGLKLRDPSPLPFRALRGQLGLFEVPDA